MWNKTQEKWLKETAKAIVAGVKVSKPSDPEPFRQSAKTGLWNYRVRWSIQGKQRSVYFPVEEEAWSWKRELAQLVGETTDVHEGSLEDDTATRDTEETFAGDIELDLNGDHEQAVTDTAGETETAAAEASNIEKTGAVTEQQEVQTYGSIELEALQETIQGELKRQLALLAEAKTELDLERERAQKAEERAEQAWARVDVLNAELTEKVAEARSSAKEAKAAKNFYLSAFYEALDAMPETGHLRRRERTPWTERRARLRTLRDSVRELETGEKAVEEAVEET